jgi:hypothetical protein
MTKFFYGVVVFNVFPILFGMAFHAGDLYTYTTTKDVKEVESWQVRENVSLDTWWQNFCF